MKLLHTLLFLTVLPALAADPPLTGSWKLDLSVNGSTYPMFCTIKQDGDKLTGACKGRENENPLTGEVQGQKITFQHQTPYNGDMLTIHYSGNLSSATEIKGTVDIQPLAIPGDFAGKKDAPTGGR